MTISTTQRVLGIADYQARWVHKSLIVELTATGILPCWNYRAQLEKRPERVVPAMWEMVFYVQDFCLKAIRPFEEKVLIHDAGGADKLIVYDAAGQHEVPIQQAFDVEPAVALEKAIDIDLFTVHARLPKSDNGPHGCIVVPFGSVLPAIYYRVFGPAPRQECEAYKAERCQPVDVALPVTGSEIPWPLAAADQPPAE